jgi:hypothetical protein
MFRFFKLLNDDAEIEATKASPVQPSSLSAT